MKPEIRSIHPLIGPAVGKWSVHSDVAATIARWRRQYDLAWDQAHKEKLERESQPVNVRTIKKAGK